MPYLMEVTGRHRVTKALRVFRFTDLAGGYNTAPGDTPASAHYAPRVNQPGNYRRNLFGSGGRTNGTADVDRGLATINNMDGKLDELRLYAFDGYDLTITAVVDKKTPFASRVPVMRGTMEQIEFGLDEITLKVRSRLALLDQPLQSATYAGTTTDATKVEAEGGEDLKGVLRLVLYGAPLNVPAVSLNRFYQIYGVGHRLDAIARVRVRGLVMEASGQDYPTLETLRLAVIADGKWASCLALGLIRFGGNIVQSGQVTVDAVEGATPATRTAAQVARRLLVERGGLVEGRDFFASDIAALDAVAPYEVGYWPGTARVTTLGAVSYILDSVGASIAPDRLGVFRIVRFEAPSLPAVKVFDRFEILNDEGATIERLATGDDGKGVPAKKVIVLHSRNHAVVTRDNLAGLAVQNDPAFVDFSALEWRQEEKAAPEIAEIHDLAPDMTFETALVKKADAEAMAIHKAGLYCTDRDRWAVKVRTDYAATVDLSKIIALDVGRYGLDGTKPLAVAGMQENLESSMTTLDVWG